MVDGKGQNQLGSILKNVRYDIHLDRELTRWLSFTMDLQEDFNLCPEINIQVFKDNQIIETINLRDKHTYIFGQTKGLDIMMLHKSISRQHVC